jgi:hypothetical protein
MGFLCLLLSFVCLTCVVWCCWVVWGGVFVVFDLWGGGLLRGFWGVVVFVFWLVVVLWVCRWCLVCIG